MSRTGLIYDENMDKHYCPWDSAHPECPERFTESLRRVRDYGLEQRCKILKSRPATDDELRGIHSEKHIELARGLRGCKDYEKLEEFFSHYDSVYANENSFDLALLSAGCTIDLMKEVLNGNIDNGMAIIRPPGHHAMTEEYCGYCLFNNVAIAAKYAIDKMGLERILIVDWDVHHGQASQYSFYDDPRVLYFSIHRYEHGSFWPELRESNYDFIGEGRGLGHNINVPLNKIGMENWDYLEIFHQILLPVAAEYRPQLILVSCGFDGSLGDPEGEMRLTPAMYSHMTRLLQPIGPLCVILEGGYCVPALAEGVALVLKTLLGDPCPRMINNENATRVPNDVITKTIKDLITVLKPFWKAITQDARVKPSKIKYIGTLGVKKPESYPTKGYHMTLSDDVTSATLSEQNFLRENTVLRQAEESVKIIPNLNDISDISRLKAHRFVVVENGDFDCLKGSKLMIDFTSNASSAFGKCDETISVSTRQLHLKTSHDAIVSAFSLILPLYYKIYPSWVILKGDAELPPALATLYSLCCTYLSAEGGLLLTTQEDSSMQPFTVTEGEFVVDEAIAKKNIQEAARMVNPSLGAFVTNGRK